MRLGSLGWLSAALGCRPLAFLGTFAYSIYLVHAPVLQVAWQYLVPADAGDAFQFVVLLGPGVVVALGCSYAFFWIAERPFLSGRPRFSMPLRRVSAPMTPEPGEAMPG